ncbi:hypothetical protein [Bartonella sp. ML70XJBT.G]|uniref:hypothetical protein n=1 Tax=Bartonella sp. ML70XJBT.G TaxID=3019093 RepID=UPI00235FDF53|nr:hypothetical protein [Bartonella sp. ML70XJBT.G]
MVEVWFVTCRIVEACWGMMRALRVCLYTKALVVHVGIMACEREGIARGDMLFL